MQNKQQSSKINRILSDFYKPSKKEDDLVLEYKNLMMKLNSVEREKENAEKEYQKTFLNYINSQINLKKSKEIYELTKIKNNNMKENICKIIITK